MTLRSNIPPTKAYYYVQASLDLTGARTGDTLYFNLDNSSSYLTKRDYTRFIILNENVLVSEVMVRTHPIVELWESTADSPYFWIGGAADTQSAVRVPWAAPANYGPIPPPGFSGRYLTLEELNANPINAFGHTAAVFPYGVDADGQPDTRSDLRYLSISITPPPSSPSSESVIKQGTVEVTIKVYSKDTLSF